MARKQQLQEYESVTRPRGVRLLRDSPAEEESCRIRAVTSTAARTVTDLDRTNSQNLIHSKDAIEGQSRIESNGIEAAFSEEWIDKRGHALSYAGIFVFTFLVYFRPYELFPSLAWLSKSALVVALFTLAVFIPSQLGLENKLTVRTGEVKLVLALLITGLLSIPLALEPARAFQSFVDFLKVVLMFVVMVNVVRTEKRLRCLILLVLFVSCLLGLAAINDYAQGNLAMEGRRIAGFIGGLFSNPNDLALQMVTMIPISLSLLLGSRGPLSKVVYLGSCVLLLLGLIATFSRAGFLGFVCVVGFLAWKLARRHRVVFGVLALIVLVAVIALAPGAYRSRIANTSDASAVARTDDLKRSILVAARHPVFGVGMDNYILYSNSNHATHNSYTQVAAEMGFAAFLIYLAFLVTSLRRLQRIERATARPKRRSSAHYLAIGLQASLVGYMVVSFFASVAYQWYLYYLIAYAISLQRLTSNSTLKSIPALTK